MYCTKEWNAEHDAKKYFNITEIPFLVVVNKEGRIDYMGSSSGTALEKNLNYLLERDPVVDGENNNEE